MKNTYKDPKKKFLRQRVGRNPSGKWWASRYVYNAVLGRSTKKEALKDLKRI